MNKKGMREMSDERMSAAERTQEGSSAVIDRHINAAKVAENNIHLLNYQAKSVDFICKKLQKQKKVLKMVRTFVTRIWIF